jgi:anaerobic ribonucleoside-triphosphate reductase
VAVIQWFIDSLVNILNLLYTNASIAAFVLLAIVVALYQIDIIKKGFKRLPKIVRVTVQIIVIFSVIFTVSNSAYNKHKFGGITLFPNLFLVDNCYQEFTLLITNNNIYPIGRCNINVNILDNQEMLQHINIYALDESKKVEEIRKIPVEQIALSGEANNREGFYWKSYPIGPIPANSTQKYFVTIKGQYLKEPKNILFKITSIEQLPRVWYYREKEATSDLHGFYTTWRASF